MVAAVLALASALGGQSKIEKEVDAIIARAAKPAESDRNRIRDIGDAAFVRIYPVVEKMLAKGDIAHNSERASVVRELISYVALSATSKRTSEMTKLFRRSGTWSGWILPWLAKTGEPRANRKLFEDELAVGYDWTAAMGLARIGDDRATQVLSKILMDPKATVEKRRAMIWNLGSIGKTKALAVVKAATHRGRVLPAFLDRLPLDIAAKDVLATHSDAAGTKWALVRWEIMGGGETLWIVRRSGAKWVAPVFTGRSSYWPVAIPSGMPVRDGHEDFELKMKALVNEKGWVAMIKDPSLRRDSDRDGIYDNVEKWVGLNPNQADTDGDGLKDGIDKNPLAKPRPMSDDDKVRQAVLAMCCLSDDGAWQNHIIGLPDGVEPFEIESCRGLVLLENPPIGFPKATGRLWARRFSIEGDVKHVSPTEAVIRMTESGGYYWNSSDVRVRKFGDEWFCVAVELRSSAVA